MFYTDGILSYILNVDAVQYLFTRIGSTKRNYAPTARRYQAADLAEEYADDATSTGFSYESFSVILPQLEKQE